MDLLQFVRGCTFDDFLFTPQHGILPRRDPDTVDLSTRFSEHVVIKRPIVSANMDTITRAAMAVVLAEEEIHPFSGTLVSWRVRPILLLLRPYCPRRHVRLFVSRKVRAQVFDEGVSIARIDHGAPLSHLVHFFRPRGFPQPLLHDDARVMASQACCLHLGLQRSGWQVGRFGA